MNILDFMLKNLPPLYKTENTLKRYKFLGKIFQEVYNKMHNMQYEYIIDMASADILEVLGNNINVPKPLGMDIETYRSILKIAYYNIFLVPTHDNLMRVTKKVTGFFPYMKPLWTFGSEEINDQGLYIAYDLDLNYNTEILLYLEKLVGAGIKIKRDFLYKMEGTTIYPACYFFDDDVLSINCEIISPIQDFKINQDLYLSQNYMQIGGL